MKFNDDLYAIAVKKNGKEIKIKARVGIFDIGVDIDGDLIFIHPLSIVTYDSDIISITIPENVIAVNIRNTSIKSIILPNSVKHLYCDKHVLGIDKIDWDCSIRLY